MDRRTGVCCYHTEVALSHGRSSKGRENSNGLHFDRRLSECLTEIEEGRLGMGL
jgi:hypothetical protein